MKPKKKPWAFCATNKPFKVQLKIECQVTGYSVNDRYASFYKPIPVKEGDVFRAVPGKGIRLNGKIVLRRARPPRRTVYKVTWVAKRLRVVVFLDRERIWSRKLKRFTKKFDKPYWTAYDVRSYNIGCGDTTVQAVNRLLDQCQHTHLLAAEEEAKGNRVIRWRCLLPKQEVLEAEKKARKTGFILEGVEVPPFPKKWIAALKRIRKS